LNTGKLYRDDESFRVVLSEAMVEAIREQARDNQEAMNARLRAIALQMSSQRVDGRDLLAFLCEMPVLTSAIIDNFSITTQKLMEVRSAEPISIVGCLECRAHLPDDNRQNLLRQLRALKYLERLEVGDLVDRGMIHTLLCEDHARAVREIHHEELRAERLALHARKAQLRKMARDNYGDYLKTPEWGAKKNRKLIMAGNRCQVCGTTAKPLDCHHNSYERLGDELLEDLVVLCRSCHQRHHGIRWEAA
jgi:hypothetical protein